MADITTEVAQLKDQGNEYYRMGSYEAARNLYTRAIMLDDNNAVLYANRAACWLSMGKYVESSNDAEKAVEIDENYSKGWIRVALANEGLGIELFASAAWDRALKSLPKGVLSPSEISMKEQIQQGLKKYQGDRENHIRSLEKGNGKMPWDLAALLQPDMSKTMSQLETQKSSVWVILGAREAFVTGFKLMQGIAKPKPDSEHRIPPFDEKKSALAHLTTAVIRDLRVFQIPEGTVKFFVGHYVMQVRLEHCRVSVQHFLLNETWNDDFDKADSDDIILVVQDMQRQNGWSAARLVLETAIRKMVTGFAVAPKWNKYTEEGLEPLSSAITLLTWAREEWKDVLHADKGPILENEFLQTLRSVRLDAMVAAYKSPNSSDLESILKEADDLLKDMKTRPISEDSAQDPGLFSSLRLYPTGRAFSAKGFYHQEMAVLKKNVKVAASKHYKEASSCYTVASRCYPHDEELHALTCHLAFENALKHDGTVLKDLADLLVHLRDILPKSKKIWAHSRMFSEIEACVKQDIAKEKKLLKLIGRGP